jgi:hypothetical protein
MMVLEQALFHGSNQTHSFHIISQNYNSIKQVSRSRAKNFHITYIKQVISFVDTRNYHKVETKNNPEKI